MMAEALMSRTVYTCSPQDSLEQATRIMWESDVGCLVVTNAENEPIGMITDRDVAIAAYTQGVPLRDSRVDSAMAHHVMTCAPNTALGELEILMRSAQIRRLPVVDTRGKLMGIVTLSDIARNAQSGPLRMTEIPGLARTFAAITERRSSASAAQ
jgi:CBS domain-containing protein